VGCGMYVPLYWGGAWERVGVKMTGFSACLLPFLKIAKMCTSDGDIVSLWLRRHFQDFVFALSVVDYASHGIVQFHAFFSLRHE